MTEEVRRGFLVDEKTSDRMGRIRQRDTKPELVVRKVLYALGHRFRCRNRDLPGSPDIANRKKQWVVFVNGCFWHHHDGCKLATIPKRNRELWIQKFKRNRERDEEVTDALRASGYRVIVVWQCETGDLEKLAMRLRGQLDATTHSSGVELA